ncbi:MAG: phosphatase PAP2 family protein [Fimbriimonadales bacterium]
MRWLYDLDMAGFKAVNVDMHRDWLTPIFWLITSTALGWVQTIIALSLLFWKKSRPYVLPLLLADLFAGFFLADGIKLMVHRQRPSNLAIALPQENEFGANSFPSGHASTAFGIAFTLWLLTRKTDLAWIGRGALGWAVLVGISRIYQGVHWPTDVIGGAFAGLVGAAGVILVLGPLGRWPVTGQDETNPKSEIRNPQSTGAEGGS